MNKTGVDMNTKISILGFAGSLRKDSYNKAILRAAASLVPGDAELSTFDLEGIPLFNQDLEKEPLEKVKDFNAKIRAADAILISTPEYNYSIPGVLKNSIDWVSKAIWRQCLGGQASCRYGSFYRHGGYGKSTISFTSMFCFFKHVSTEPSRGHGTFCS